MKNLNTRITAILLLVALCAVMIVPAMAAAPTGYTCADGTVVSCSRDGTLLVHHIRPDYFF